MTFLKGTMEGIIKQPIPIYIKQATCGSIRDKSKLIRNAIGGGIGWVRLTNEEGSRDEGRDLVVEVQVPAYDSDDACQG